MPRPNPVECRHDPDPAARDPAVRDPAWVDRGGTLVPADMSNARAPHAETPSAGWAPNRREVTLGTARLAALAMMGVTGLAAPGLIGPARAAGAVGGVVELFTSQGCSSCPPADALLGEMIESGEAIGLAHHVDYWDYLGWADPLATRAGTQRQYAYARTFDRRGVYTPQAVVNGREHHVGSRATAIREALAAHRARKLAPSLDVAIQTSGAGGRVSIGPPVAPAGTATPTEAVVTVLHYLEAHRQAIARGENRGREITYHHPVTAFETLGPWTGGAMELDFGLPALSVPGGTAVLVQERSNGAPGAILGAAALPRTG